MGQRVIVITGTTCSGKSYLGLKLAQLLNGEIISADSRQIYKKLCIGTAKPSATELQKVKHHFIDILNPDEDYDANKFSIQAEKVINEIQDKNITAVVVGGSGLYIKALIEGIIESAVKDEDLREILLSKKQKYGVEFLYTELKKVDPVSSEKMLPQNWKRVIRALEVYHLTGRPIWQHHINQNKIPKFNFYQIGLNWDREVLYRRVEERVDEMIGKGLVEEVKSILDDGYDKNLNSLNTVGYKEIISYLEDEITLDRAIELIKRNTRRYAKRQLTWFRADERIKWINVSSQEGINNLTLQLIKDID
ncbi:MAG: tRNA (adenosine(37)-N6)-dimethylallyltransferase MiaA [Ignavibacteria bacterium]|nr:tRNA (adenosine(37)-N6)-dimethylallyltransferase MiaA [Ignavibacteria bacterium]